MAQKMKAANKMQRIIELVAERCDSVEFYSDVSCEALLRAFLRVTGNSHHMLLDLPLYMDGHCSFAQNAIGLGHAGLSQSWNNIAKLLVALSAEVDECNSDWFSKNKKKADRSIARGLDRLSAKLPQFLHNLGVWGAASTFLFAWEFANHKEFRDVVIELWITSSPVRDSMRFEYSVLNRFQWASLSDLDGSKNTISNISSVVWTDNLRLENFVKYGRTDILMTDPAAAMDILARVSDIATILKLVVDNYGYLRNAYSNYHKRFVTTRPFIIEMFYCPDEGNPQNKELFVELCMYDAGFLMLHELQGPLQQMFYLSQKHREMDTLEHLIGNLHNSLAVPLFSHVCFLGMSDEPEVERTMKGYSANYQIFIDYSLAVLHGYRAITTNDLKWQMRTLSTYIEDCIEIPVVEMEQTALKYSPGVYCFSEIMSCAKCCRLLQPDECLHWNGRYFCMKSTELDTEVGNCMLKYFCDHRNGVGHGVMFRLNEKDVNLLPEFALNAMRGGGGFGVNPTMRRLVSFVIDMYHKDSRKPLTFIQSQSQHICEYLQRFCVDHQGVSEKITYMFRTQIQWQAHLHTLDNISRSIRAMKHDKVFVGLGIQLCQLSFHTLCMYELQNKHGVDIINYLTTSRYAKKDVNFHGNLTLRATMHLPGRGDAQLEVCENNITIHFPEKHFRGLAHVWLGSLFMATRIPLSVHYKSAAKLKVLVCKVARYFILMRLNSCLKWKALSGKLVSMHKAIQHHRRYLLTTTITVWPNKKMACRSSSRLRDAIGAWKLRVTEQRSADQAIVARARQLAAMKLLKKLLEVIKERKRLVASKYGALWLRDARRARRARCINKLRVYGSFRVWKSRLSVLKRDKILSTYVTCVQEMLRKNMVNKAFHCWRSIARQWILKREQYASVVEFAKEHETNVLRGCFHAIQNKCAQTRALLSRFQQRKETRLKRVFLAQLTFLVQERRIDTVTFVAQADLGTRPTCKLNLHAQSYVPPSKPPPLPPLPYLPKASPPLTTVHIPVPVPYPVMVDGSRLTNAIIAEFVRNAQSQVAAAGGMNYPVGPEMTCLNFGFGDYPVNTDAVGVYGQSFMA